MILENYDIDSIQDYLKEFVIHVDDENPEIGMIFITTQHNGDTVYVHSNLNNEVRSKIILAMAKKDMSENQGFQRFSKKLNELLNI